MMNFFDWLVHAIAHTYGPYEDRGFAWAIRSCNGCWREKWDI